MKYFVLLFNSAYIDPRKMLFRVQTFLGDPKKSPIGDFRRPHFFKKETKRRLKKETFGRMRRYRNIPVYT